MENTYQYPHKKVHLLTYFAYIQSGNLKANEHEEYQWVSIGELDDFDFLEADEPIISKLESGLYGGKYPISTLRGVATKYNKKPNEN